MSKKSPPPTVPQAPLLPAGPAESADTATTTQTTTSSENTGVKTVEEPAPVPAAPLRTDGPTVEEYVKAGYDPKNYPPGGYASKSTPAEVEAAIERAKIDEAKKGGTEPVPPAPEAAKDGSVEGVHVLCAIPNASKNMGGLEYAWSDEHGGMVSVRPMSLEAAQRLATIQGFRIL